MVSSINDISQIYICGPPTMKTEIIKNMDVLNVPLEKYSILWAEVFYDIFLFLRIYGNKTILTGIACLKITIDLTLFHPCRINASI